MENMQPQGGAVPVQHIDFGSHGDHWRAFFGFEVPDEKILRLMLTGREAPGTMMRGYAVHDVPTAGDIGVRLITDGRKHVLSGYPILHTDLLLPFEQRTIFEWKHVHGIEAQIGGGGRSKFALRFFATDYLERKDEYTAQRTINVHLSGFAFALKEYDSPEVDMAYLPNQDFRAGDVFDFLGACVLSAKPYASFDTRGYILRLRILEIKDGDEHWNWDLDMFVHETTTEIRTFEAGMKLAGCFWLQGHLAK